MSAPPTVTGPDGLPHCGWCDGERLCGYHKNRVEAALNGLKTAALMGNAATDLRYIIKRPSLDMKEDMREGDTT